MVRARRIGLNRLPTGYGKRRAPWAIDDLAHTAERPFMAEACPRSLSRPRRAKCSRGTREQLPPASPAWSLFSHFTFYGYQASVACSARSLRVTVILFDLGTLKKPVFSYTRLALKAI